MPVPLVVHTFVEEIDFKEVGEYMFCKKLILNGLRGTPLERIDSVRFTRSAGKDRDGFSAIDGANRANMR